MTNDLPIKFGKRLQEIRIIKNLTQSKLAEMIGVETMTISRIENGSQFPKHETINRLSTALNIEVKDLFSFKNTLNKAELIEKLYNILKNSNLQDLKFYDNIISCHIEYLNCNKTRQRTSSKINSI